jgi:predicted nucleic acid-binding protein
MAVASRLVLDASVALSWCFEDEASALGDAVLRHLERDAAIVPAIWPIELANGLRSAERRGRLDRQSVEAVGALLMALPIQVEESSRLDEALGRILPLALEASLTAYDAAYLDLALRHGLPLATADDQLARAAQAAGVTLVEVG